MRRREGGREGGREGKRGEKVMLKWKEKEGCRDIMSIVAPKLHRVHVHCMFRLVTCTPTAIPTPPRGLQVYVGSMM